MKLYTKGKHILCNGMLAFVGSMLLMACKADIEPYPNLVTEFADMRTNTNGVFVSMTTDNGARYGILNTNIAPLMPDTTYRAVVGFVQKSVASIPKAEIYTLAGVRVLADSTSTVLHHPTNIASMWQRGKYINMQLTALTQGGTHHWGYAVDSVQTNGNNTHHHLSIHHNQGKDPISYSQTYYASILLSSIPHYQMGDTISVAVHTFGGIKKWMFCR